MHEEGVGMYYGGGRYLGKSLSCLRGNLSLVHVLKVLFVSYQHQTSGHLVNVLLRGNRV